MNFRSLKTILIVVGRGFIAKSILRSGVLTELKKSGHRIVLLFWSVHGQPMPDTLRREFASDNVIVETVLTPRISRWHRRFRILTALLVYNENNRKFRYLATGGNRFVFWFKKISCSNLAKIEVLKRLARWAEEKIFKTENFTLWFEQYRPNLVFSTSVISSVDIEFMKEAKRRGVKIVSMPRGWDNVGTIFYKVMPDLLLVQNEMMKRDAVTFQRFVEERVKVVGFPQFDWYRRPEILQTREDFFRTRQLDPAKKLILWGSTGRLTQQSVSICNLLTRAVQAPEELIRPSQLLIRAHFSDVKNNRFDYLKGNRAVAIDDNITRSDFFYDGVDPGIEEIIGLANTLYHADLVIVQSSTLSLDALCYDKPVINTAYGGLYDGLGRDITPILYTENCYRPLIDLGAVTLAENETALLVAINQYLENPALHRAERARALAVLAHRVDGRASRRIADAILSLLMNHESARFCN